MNMLMNIYGNKKFTVASIETICSLYKARLNQFERLSKSKRIKLSMKPKKWNANQKCKLKAQIEIKMAKKCN